GASTRPDLSPRGSRRPRPSGREGMRDLVDRVGAAHKRGMRQRYTYRAYPSMGQQRRAARAFGCARVVFNDYLVASKAAYEAGVKVSSAELGRQVTTLAKRT